MAIYKNISAVSGIGGGAAVTLITKAASRSGNINKVTISNHDDSDSVVIKLFITDGSSDFVIAETTIPSRTTLVLDDVSNFPNSGTVLIGSELITYTARDTSAQELQNATRGANNTNASAHENNKKVTNYSTVRIHQSNVTPTTTKIDTRGRARQANILISSEAVNDKWRFGTLRLDVKPDGGR